MYKAKKVIKCQPCVSKKFTATKTNKGIKLQNARDIAEKMCLQFKETFNAISAPVFIRKTYQNLYYYGQKDESNSSAMDFLFMFETDLSSKEYLKYEENQEHLTSALLSFFSCFGSDGINHIMSEMGSCYFKSKSKLRYNPCNFHSYMDVIICFYKLEMLYRSVNTMWTYDPEKRMFKIC